VDAIQYAFFHVAGDSGIKRVFILYAPQKRQILRVEKRFRLLV